MSPLLQFAFLTFADIDAYCVIKCEGEKVKSQIVSKTSKPEWNVSAIFYRKNPVGNPITVEVCI